MASPSKPLAPRLLDGLGIAALLALWAPAAWRFCYLIDDAFIAFRYARNWAEGLGLRYNAGSGPPVEGFSDFLWVIVLAIAHALGARLELAANVLSAACAAATLVALYVWLRRRGLGAQACFGGAALCATTPAFFVWSTGGLETAAATLALFATWALFSAAAAGARRSTSIQAGAAGAALTLLRVEGIAWVVFVALLAAVVTVPRGERRAALARTVPGLCVTGAVFAAQLAFRAVHFGALVPNTVHAKSSLSADTLARGLDNSVSWLIISIAPALVLLLAPWVLRRAESAHRRLATSAGLVVVALIAWNTLVGGDWMPFFRFLVPTTPFLGVLTGLALARLRPLAAWPLTLLVCTLSWLPAWNVNLAPKPWREALYFRSFLVGYQTEFERWALSVDNGESYCRIGRALAIVSEPDETVVMGPIGAIGWYTRLPILGRNGLVTPEGAQRSIQGATATESAGHDKRVPRSWFIDRRPSYFTAHLVPPGRGQRGSKPFNAAARAVARKLLEEDPAEAALFDHALPYAYEIGPEQGFAIPMTLFVLRWEDDSARARAYWGSISGPRRER